MCRKLSDSMQRRLEVNAHLRSFRFSESFPDFCGTKSSIAGTGMEIDLCNNCGHQRNLTNSIFQINQNPIDWGPDFVSAVQSALAGFLRNSYACPFTIAITHHG